MAKKHFQLCLAPLETPYPRTSLYWLCVEKSNSNGETKMVTKIRIYDFWNFKVPFFAHNVHKITYIFLVNIVFKLYWIDFKPWRKLKFIKYRFLRRFIGVFTRFWRVLNNFSEKNFKLHFFLFLFSFSKDFFCLKSGKNGTKPENSYYLVWFKTELYWGPY